MMKKGDKGKLKTTKEGLSVNEKKIRECDCLLLEGNFTSIKIVGTVGCVTRALVSRARPYQSVKPIAPSQLFHSPFPCNCSAKNQ